MALFRLAYISTSLLAGRSAARRGAALGDILLMSRRNNEAVHVTGALLATESNFAQVLEGERADVETIYARISIDPRHKDLVLLLAGSLTAREFPKWSMAFIGPSHSADEAVRRVAGNLSATERGDRARHFVTFMRDMLMAVCAKKPPPHWFS